MKTIHKQTISIDGLDQSLEGVGYICLVAMQDGDLTIWYEHKEIARPRTFQVFGTGHPIPHNYHHVASVLDGWFVWHLREKL